VRISTRASGGRRFPDTRAKLPGKLARQPPQRFPLFPASEKKACIDRRLAALAESVKSPAVWRRACSSEVYFAAGFAGGLRRAKSWLE
jgi:hypothetical protein